MSSINRSFVLACLVAPLVLCGCEEESQSTTSQARGLPVEEHPAGTIRTFDEDLGLKMVWCPPGSFLMGLSKSDYALLDSLKTEAQKAREEIKVPYVLIPPRPSQTPVTLTHGFWTGQTEITQRQWKAVMGTEPWQGHEGAQEGPNIPASYITWEMTQEFCRKLSAREREARRLSPDQSYRLPTEAEWEYACRAGTTTLYNFGDEMSRLDEHAWFRQYTEGEHFPYPVATKLPNPWGLYDMHGNVLEWCTDNMISSPAHVGSLPNIDPPGFGAGPERSVDFWVDFPDAIPGFVEAPMRPLRGGPSGGGRGVEGSIREIKLFGRGDDFGFRVVIGTSPPASPITPAIPLGSPPAGSVRSFGEGPTLELAWCPPGAFVMGSPEWAADCDEKPQRVVVLSKGFWLGQTEITQSQWKAVMGTEPWKGQGGPGNRFLEGPNYPAGYIRWDQAQEFCQKLTQREQKERRIRADQRYRLPTEAEWEYACRAGTTTVYSFGDDMDQLPDYAWFGLANEFRLKGENSSHPVGTRKPNPWNLSDMHGNVWEWCQDFYDQFAYKRQSGILKDPVVDKNWPAEGGNLPTYIFEHVVVRGGAWLASPGSARSAARGAAEPTRFANAIGLRVALDP